MTAEQYNKLNKLRAIKISRNLSYETAEFRLIKNFIDWCSSHNIRVIATWPNTIRFDDYQKPALW